MIRKFRFSKIWRIRIGLLIIVIILVLMWQLRYIFLSSSSHKHADTDTDLNRNDKLFVKYGNTLKQIGNNDNSVFILNGRPGLGTSELINIAAQKNLTEEEIECFKINIAESNEEQKIYNLEKFGFLTLQSFVLVIQVHSRVEYLSHLIESLSKVRGINDTLIILSHDLYIPKLNEAIRNIDFARVMQIFLPYTLQLNPNRFPGQSPDDCQRDISLEKAREIKCRNAEHPDIYGHYREASYTQIKHHYWWKANFVFRDIRVLQNYSNVITFLEEDQYVTPDFLWTLNLMETLMNQDFCQGCNLLVLGTYQKPWNIQMVRDHAVVTNWISSKHNMGMSFNRTLWGKLKSCAEFFCKYDDYNWDWTLLEMSENCLTTPLTVLYAKAARIFHIGDCGMHHKKICNPIPLVQAINKNFRQSEYKFPENIEVEIIKETKILLNEKNGGWGDIRDHHLCLSF